MSYTKTNWANLPSTTTPINADNLNKIENELVTTSYTITNTPTHSTGTNVYQLVKYGQFVNLNMGALWIDGLTKDTWTTLGQLPNALKPSERKSNVCYCHK